MGSAAMARLKTAREPRLSHIWTESSHSTARDSKLLRNGSSRFLYAIYGYAFGSAMHRGSDHSGRGIDATIHHIIIQQYSTILYNKLYGLWAGPNA